jgi:hypothetical protein
MYCSSLVLRQQAPDINGPDSTQQARPGTTRKDAETYRQKPVLKAYKARYC